LPASSQRKSRIPGFMARLAVRKERSLFGDGGGDVEVLFGGLGDDGNQAASGVESLAPPLPPPPSHLTGETAERLGRAIAALRTTADRLGAEAAANALEIGCLVARKILEAELKTDAGAFVSLVHSAVRRLGEVHKVTIHLSPGDVEAIEAVAGHASMSPLGIAKVEIVPDTNLTPGDCIVESDAAMVDGRLGTRLEELHRVLSLAIANTGDDAS
jgi:flagellar biosynthesis/type III secretory pathway protein FliH